MLLWCAVLPAAAAFPVDITTPGIEWTMTCSDGTALSGAAPFSGDLDVGEGASCTTVLKYRVSNGLKLIVGEPMSVSESTTEIPSSYDIPSFHSVDDHSPPRVSIWAEMEPRRPLKQRTDVSVVGTRRRIQTNSSAANVTAAPFNCVDAPSPFDTLVPGRSVVVVGSECSDLLPFSGFIFHALVGNGGLEAVCKATVGDWAQEASNVAAGGIYFWATWSPPIALTAQMAELCPTTCAAAGVYTEGCNAPPTPPRAPTLPSQPPAPPLAPGRFSAGTVVISSPDQLHAALAATPPAGVVNVYLPRGFTLHLAGAPLVVGTINLTISSEEGGAIIDADHLSPIFDLQPGAQLNLQWITLANGFSPTSGGVASVVSAAVVLSNCVAVNSSAANGGSFALISGQLMLVDSTVAASYANKDGGALVLSGTSSVVLRKSRVISSSASRFGGAICIFGGDVLVTEGSSIVECEADAGGALYLRDGAMTVTGRSSITRSFAKAAVQVRGSQFRERVSERRGE